MRTSRLKRVPAFFFASQSGHEPVREWLMALERGDRKVIGRALMTLEFGWPVGMPLSRPMGHGLHELRVTASSRREARVFFYIDRQERLILLHSIIKTARSTPRHDLDLARRRMREHQRGIR
jgi:phage-related protein